MSIRMGKKNKNTNDRRTKVYVSLAGPVQPRPTFFSDAQIERMNKQPGSYQYKGR